jgi:hypothetical protein
MYLSFVVEKSENPNKRRKHNAPFRAEALRLAERSRSTQAAVRALNIIQHCSTAGGRSAGERLGNAGLALG